ncbi:MucR family transcriptional regulator [Methylobacterium sp. ID0610]|uniref:MucR family transcriptional regulator n=1 Tax=Methylobacterium carpenticola TaxID=3344827 RepID=UPI00369A1C7A
MTDRAATAQPDLINLSAGIVSAYVSSNSVPLVDLAGLIVAVHTSLTTAASPPRPAPEKPVPPIPIRKTVTPDAIISLEDGKPYKALKRHLSGRGLTPDQYREKWGLPPGYPMVAANYAAQRAELAKTHGLGQVRRERAAAAATAPADPVKRSRSRKSA